MLDFKARMKLSIIAFICFLLFPLSLSGQSSILSIPVVSQKNKILFMNKNGKSDENLGIQTVLKVSKNYAIMGMPLKSSGSITSGGAYIFKRSDKTWVSDQELIASDGKHNDTFGWSVAITDKFAMIGSLKNSGTIYIYELVGASWVYKQKITASDPTPMSSYGESIDIQGNYAIVGAYTKRLGNNYSQGIAYIYKYQNNQWVETQRLIASDGGNEEFFGFKVSMSANYALISAPFKKYNKPYKGAAYIFYRDEDKWIEHQKLIPDAGDAGDEFGNGIAIKDTYAVLGSLSKTLGGSPNRRKVCIYKNQNGKWVQIKTILNDTNLGIDFRGDVNFSEDDYIIGCYGGIVAGKINK
jgi:hypothetical protein